jgi:hypothetical protein
MASRARSIFIALLTAIGSSACVSITSVTPDPAAPGTIVRLHLSNVIGPTHWEPGATLTFDGEVMPLSPHTASVVGFVVPEGKAEGTYTIEVRDGPGFFEIITIVALFRVRSDSASLVVGSE